MANSDEQLMGRRAFLKGAAAGGAGLVLSANAPDALAKTLQSTAPGPDWSKQIGLELYTVRDLMADNRGYLETLEKVADMGYREVEPAGGYAGLSPRGFRALLDGLGLSMPSTHSGAHGTGADLEKQLEGFQIMGIQYMPRISTTNFSFAAYERKYHVPPGGYYNPGDHKIYDAFTQCTAFGPYQPRITLKAAKQEAAKLNADGKIASKFGIKVLKHNHTGEFEKLLDSDQTEYEILLAETDPELVVMQLDIGWARIAGVDVLELFQKHPGRFILWHIKDEVGLKTVNPSLSPNQRTSSMAFVPVGTGDVDYAAVFAQASLAGMKHFAVEQDNAACWGDSVAAARVSCNNLRRMLG